MPRLLLLTPAEVSRDPRARRQAQAATALGLDVGAVSGQISGEEPAPLTGVDVIRVGGRGRTDPSWMLGSAARREAAVLRELRGLVRLLRLGGRTWQLVRGARAWGRPDAVHANDFATLPAGYLIARRGGSRLVYDAHELYCAFEPDPPRLATALAARVEGALARRADAVVTVSDALAGELQKRFRLARRPEVVLNAPELTAEGPAAPETDGPLRAIYQGGFGPGRTLEDLVAVMRRAPHVAFTLRIPRTRPHELRQALVAHDVPNADVVEPVTPEAVVRSLHGFDVGILFDRPLTRNAELGLPNKLFEYLMAGLAIVAPRLEGVTSVVDVGGVGVTVPPGRPEAVGEALERLADVRAAVRERGARARELARSRFNAERQTDALAHAWAV